METIGIIGGGPAGAMAAERIARGAGAARMPKTRVLVFEEKRGWEKPCGGGLSHKALQMYPDILNAACELQPARQAEFVAPDGVTARFNLRRPLAVCSRSALNRGFLDRAARAGAAIVEDRIVALEREGRGWGLRGQRTSYRVDFLVLAAGARSRLRRYFAADFRVRDFMLTLGYFVPARDDILRIEFFGDFEGYAWSFPRTDHLSIGICGKAGDCTMGELRERLRGFIRRFGYSMEGAAVFSHLLPALEVETWSNLRLAGQGWALAGDSAGLVDPLTGEGIYYAMRSGELLADSLLAKMPEAYPARVKQEFGNQLALGARLAPLFYRGDFLGAPVVTRMIDFASRSRTFMELLQDLMEGSQGYAGLAARLYRGLGKALVEIAAGRIRDAFNPATVWGANN